MSQQQICNKYVLKPINFLRNLQITQVHGRSIPGTISSRCTGFGQYLCGRLVLSQRPYQPALALVLGFCFYIRDLFASTCLDVLSISWFVVIEPSSRGGGLRYGIFLGLPKSSAASGVAEFRATTSSTALDERRGSSGVEGQSLRVDIISLRRHAPPSTRSISRGERSSCAPPTAPRRDWEIRTRYLHAVRHRRPTSVCRSFGPRRFV